MTLIYFKNNQPIIFSMGGQPHLVHLVFFVWSIQTQAFLLGLYGSVRDRVVGLVIYILRVLIPMRAQVFKCVDFKFFTCVKYSSSENN